MSRKEFLNYVYIVMSVLVVAGLGTLFTSLGMTWYIGLSKPSMWVPSFVFPVVWSAVYIIAIVLMIFYKSRGILDLKSIILFALNGLLNVIWCLVFFTLGLTLLGNIVIILNLILSIYLFLEIVDKPLGFLLAIYPFWLCIATSLNLAIWILN